MGGSTFVIYQRTATEHVWNWHGIATEQPSVATARPSGAMAAAPLKIRYRAANCPLLQRAVPCHSCPSLYLQSVQQRLPSTKQCYRACARCRHSVRQPDGDEACRVLDRILTIDSQIHATRYVHTSMVYCSRPASAFRSILCTR